MRAHERAIRDLLLLVTCTPWVSMEEEKKADFHEDTVARCGEVFFLGKVIILFHFLLISRLRTSCPS